MKKYFNLNSIVFLVIGLILGGFVAYAAGSSYSSDQILYNKSSEQHVLTSVINDIYDKLNYGNATAADLPEGISCLSQGKKIQGTGTNTNMCDTTRKTIIYLGQGTSFNLTQYNGYQNFTNENFLVEGVDVAKTNSTGRYHRDQSEGDDYYVSVKFDLIKSYNGTLTANTKTSADGGYYHASNGYWSTDFPNIDLVGEVKAWLVLDNSQAIEVGSVSGSTKKNVVFLGESQTFDLNTFGLNDISNYTENDFIVEPVSQKLSKSSPRAFDDADWYTAAQFTLSKTYNASTGTLNAYAQPGGFAGIFTSTGRSQKVSTTPKSNVKVYLLTD